MLASSTCAGFVVALFNPLDCLRIRWQIASADVQVKSLGQTRYALQVVSREGLVKGLWAPGVGSNAAACFLARGIGLGAYPSLRDGLQGLTAGGGDADATANAHTGGNHANANNANGNGGGGGGQKKGGGTMFLAGLLAGGVGYGLANPLWLMKTQLQGALGAGRPPPYGGSGARGLWEVARGQGGIAALYRGAPMLVVRGALMNSGNTLGYDGTKTLSAAYGVLEDGPVLHVAGSVASAFCASSFSVPADVVLTRYHTSPRGTYPSPLACASGMWRAEGPAVFVRGWLALFGRQAPLYVVFLPLYEQMRRLLGLGYLK